MAWSASVLAVHTWHTFLGPEGNRFLLAPFALQLEDGGVGSCWTGEDDSHALFAMEEEPIFTRFTQPSSLPEARVSLGQEEGHGLSTTCAEVDSCCTTTVAWANGLNTSAVG